MGSSCNNNKQSHDDDNDSWEVRAFEEDTVGCSTWPPRSYTCTFCRREFRSAQALGGHMNVHRRDRARLHRVAPRPDPPESPAMPRPGTNTLCILYPIIPPDRHTTAIFIPASAAATPYFLPDPSHTGASSNNGINNNTQKMEDVDLELRLGR